MFIRLSIIIISLAHICVHNVRGKEISSQNISDIFVSATDKPLVIRNVNVIDVIGGSILPCQNILIKEGRIEDISPVAGDGLEGLKIEGEGAYVVPGLIDAHIHIANGGPAMDINSCYPHLRYFLRHGITSIRDAGGDASVLGRLRREVESGARPGPRIYYAAYMAGPEFMEMRGIVDSTQFNPWNQSVGPDTDLERAMTAAKSCGADGIKLYASFSPELLKDIVEAADRHGLMTWAHSATFSAKPRDVAEAGVKVLSHVYMLQWENIKEDLTNDILGEHYKHQKNIDLWNVDILQFCETMKRHDAILDATLCVSYPNEGDWIMKCLREVYENGVKICAGSDCVNLLDKEHPYLYDELDYFVNLCGFSTIDALRSATIIAAEALGAEEVIGSVEKGKKADLLILGANPLEDISNLKNRIAVIKDGRIIQ